MKIKSIVFISVLFLSFILLTSANTTQEKIIFEGIYDGSEDYGYNFIGVDKNGEEYTMTFHKIDDELLKGFNLKSDALVGSKFSVTYSTEIKNETDEDGYDVEIQTNTILALKKL